MNAAFRLVNAVWVGGLIIAGAEPHPETGLEYWAIQAAPVAGEVLCFGRIAKLSFEADDLGRSPETAIDVTVDQVLRGPAISRAWIVEERERFRVLAYNRRLTGRFFFYLQPSVKRDGFITYWDGFGVRELGDGDGSAFARRLAEWPEVAAAAPKSAKRVAMLEWGLRCAETRITQWEGALAIRDAIHPGTEYRDHAEAMKAVTAERRNRIRAAYLQIRNQRPRDQRIGTVMLEAVAWLTPDPLFHHEVRIWSAKLANDPADWEAHFDEFWKTAERRMVPGESAEPGEPHELGAGNDDSGR